MNTDILNIIFTHTDKHIITEGYIKGKKICMCKINILGNKWTISSWYSAIKHKGYGKAILSATLKNAVKIYGIPEKIEYVWDGSNSYVYEWLNKNFGALSKCPIAVQKYANDDDWESHIYTLNRDKVLEYFKIIEIPDKR